MKRARLRLLSAIVLAFFVSSLAAPVVQAATARPAASGKAQILLKVPNSTELIDLNTATKAQLMKLPGIGEQTAARLIASRNARGPVGFKSMQDFIKLKNVGPAKVSALEGAQARPVASEHYWFEANGRRVDLNNTNQVYVAKRLAEILPNNADVNAILNAARRGPITSNADLLARLRQAGYRGPLTGTARPKVAASENVIRTEAPKASDTTAPKAPATKPVPRTPSELYATVQKSQNAVEAYNSLRSAGVEEALAKEIARVRTKGAFQSVRDMAGRVESLQKTSTGQRALADMKKAAVEAQVKASRAKVDQWSKVSKEVASTKPASYKGYDEALANLRKIKYEMGRELLTEASLKGAPKNAVMKDAAWLEVNKRIETLEQGQKAFAQQRAVAGRKAQLTKDLGRLQESFVNLKKSSPSTEAGFAKNLKSLQETYAETLGRVAERASLDGKQLTEAQIRSNPELKAIDQQIKLQEGRQADFLQAKQKALAEARTKAQAEARAKAKAEATAKAEAAAKAKAEATAKAEAAAKVKADAAAKAAAKAEAVAKAKAQSAEVARIKELSQKAGKLADAKASETTAPKAPASSAKPSTVEACDVRATELRSSFDKLVSEARAKNPAQFKSAKDVWAAANKSGGKGELGEIYRVAKEIRTVRATRAEILKTSNPEASAAKQEAAALRTKMQKLQAQQAAEAQAKAAKVEAAKVEAANKVAKVEAAKVEAANKVAKVEAAKVESAKASEAPAAPKATAKATVDYTNVDSLRAEANRITTELVKSGKFANAKQVYEASQQSGAKGDLGTLNSINGRIRNLRASVKAAAEPVKVEAAKVEAAKVEAANKVAKVEAAKVETAKASETTAPTAPAKTSWLSKLLGKKPAGQVPLSEGNQNFLDSLGGKKGVEAKSVDILKGHRVADAKATSSSGNSKFVNDLLDVFKKPVAGETPVAPSAAKATAEPVAGKGGLFDGLLNSWKEANPQAKNIDILKGHRVADAKAASTQDASFITKLLQGKGSSAEAVATAKASELFNPAADAQSLGRQISDLQGKSLQLKTEIKSSNPGMTEKAIYESSRQSNASGKLLELQKVDNQIHDLRVSKSQVAEMAKVKASETPAAPESTGPKAETAKVAGKSSFWDYLLGRSGKNSQPAEGAKVTEGAKPAETAAAGGKVSWWQRLFGKKVPVAAEGVTVEVAKSEAPAPSSAKITKASAEELVSSPKVTEPAATKVSVKAPVAAKAVEQPLYSTPKVQEVTTLDGQIGKLSTDSNALAKQLVESGQYKSLYDVVKASRQPGASGELARLSQMRTELQTLRGQRLEVAKQATTQAETVAKVETAKAVKAAEVTANPDLAQAQAQVKTLKADLLKTAQDSVAQGKFANVKEALRAPEFKGKADELMAIDKALKAKAAETTGPKTEGEATKASETTKASQTADAPPALRAAEARAMELRTQIQQLEAGGGQGGLKGLFSKFTKGTQLKNAKAELAKVEGEIGKMKGDATYLAEKNKDLAVKNPAQAKLIAAVQAELAKPDLKPAYRAELQKRLNQLEGTPGHSFTKSALQIVGISIGTNLVMNVYRQMKEDGKVDWSKATSFLTDKKFWMSSAGTAVGAYMGSKVAMMPFYYLLSSKVAAMSPIGGLVLSLIPAFLGGALGGQLMGGDLASIDWLMMLGQTLGSVVGTALAMTFFPGAGMIGQLAGAMIGGFLAEKLISMFRGPESESTERAEGGDGDVEPLPGTTKASGTFDFTQADVDQTFTAMQEAYQRFVTAENSGKFGEAASAYGEYTELKHRLDAMRQSSFNAAQK